MCQEFKLKSNFKPTGDQPMAIEKLSKGILSGARDQVLLGVTGSGKTYTMAGVIEKIQRPVLIISHNKTLAWQLYKEFKEFFPNNAVHYFVSYYDYYQPEAYIPQSDAYIEKDARINEKIDQMRHAATQDLLTRPDTIIVASVSCIYNIGSPEDYNNLSLAVSCGQKLSRKTLLSHLITLGYTRNEVDPKPGQFRAKGERIEIYPATGDKVIAVELSTAKVQKIVEVKAEGVRVEGLGFSKKNSLYPSSTKIFPAHFWSTPEDKQKIAIANIRNELHEHLKLLGEQNKLLEAQRLEQRTNFDLEMIEETGFCHGIENYSRHLDFRKPSEAPYTLLDYYKYNSNLRMLSESTNKNFLTFIDESHMTIPQLRGMYFGDRSRKQTLIEYGFRLPSAIDNRPLNFSEFNKRIWQTIYVSATPAEYEIKKAKNKSLLNNCLSADLRAGLAWSSREARGKPARASEPRAGPERNRTLQAFAVSFGAGGARMRRKIIIQQTQTIVEQLIRPTGLLDPSVEVRPAKNQMKDLIKEIQKRTKRNQRVLVTTITKRLAEDIAEYLAERDIKAYYLHSEIHTLERPKILHDLRRGIYDVVVGINLLREGLDLPEVSLVAILDADKEGFLRNDTTLIQTMGRAARHVDGHIIMYADVMTGSMRRAIRETKRRRKIQEGYNKKNRITPKSIKKPLEEYYSEELIKESTKKNTRFNTSIKSSILEKASSLDLLATRELEKEMKKAAKNLNFEKAAELRDKISSYKNRKIRA